MKTRPSDFTEEKHEDINDLEACAHDLIGAIQASDAKRVAEAIKSMFEIADSQPHEEGPHIEESEGVE